MLTLLEIHALEQRLLTSKLLPPLKMEASSQRWRDSRDGDDMEAEIWSELPNHLVYKVLALLPFRDFVRLQWVCRRWSRLVDSQSFLDEFSQGPPENPWFAIVGDARKVNSLPGVVTLSKILHTTWWNQHSQECNFRILDFDFEKSRGCNFDIKCMKFPMNMHITSSPPPPRLPG